MIVVEGPDGAGKSTLVRRICDEFGLKEGTRGTQNRDLLYTVTLPDTMRALACAVQSHREPYVWDRLYFSDFVYAPIQDREVAFNFAQQDHIEAILAALDCPIIMCLPPFGKVEVAAGKVHQMESVDENLFAIYEMYTLMYENAQESEAAPFFFRYDYTTMGVDEPLRFIESYLNTRKERSL